MADQPERLAEAESQGQPPVALLSLLAVLADATSAALSSGGSR
jgi:hypothetical protein